MHRLGELTDRQRLRFGGGALVLGLLLMVVAVTVVHIYGRPAEQVPSLEPFRSMFTGIDQGAHKYLKGVGYFLVFGASQLMIGGAAVIWVLNQKMTWARAGFAAFLAWMEMVFVFGVVPSEWLNFSQTDLDWSTQNIWFDVPKFLVLNNDVQISFGAVKDAISGGYNMVMLVLAGLFAYKLQDIGKPRPAGEAKSAPVSPYGRPLIKRSKDEG